MAHGSNQRKKPDKAVRDCICRYFIKKRHVEARDLCASSLRRDPYFIRLLRSERCISLRHKSLNPLIDETVKEMIGDDRIVLQDTAWVMDEQFSRQVLSSRPRRPGSPPKTVKRRNSRTATQRPVTVG